MNLIATWGLYWVLSPYPQSPSLEMYNYKSSSGRDACVYEAKSLWQDYWVSHPKNMYFYTYCALQKGHKTTYVYIKCASDGVCDVKG